MSFRCFFDSISLERVSDDKWAAVLHHRMDLRHPCALITQCYSWTSAGRYELVTPAIEPIDVNSFRIASAAPLTVSVSVQSCD
jgi:hypothetical protein